MVHEDNEHWWLAEYNKGEVVYVPVSYMMMIVDETVQEEGGDKTRIERQENSTDGTKIGEDMRHDGERRKTHSAAGIDVIKRNLTIYVGDSIFRKTDTRLSNGGGRSIVFTGSKNRACDRESREDHGKRKWRDLISTRRVEQRRQEGTTAIVEKYNNPLKMTKQARAGQILLSGILPVYGNRIHGYRNSKRMAVNGMVERLCKEEDVGNVDLWDSFVRKEDMYARDGLHLSGKRQ